jgi:putative tricarboxylic transport membrane protein
VQSAKRADRAAIVVAALLGMLAVVILFDMSRLTITSTYGVGPKMMPIVVAIGIAILAGLNLLVAFREGLPLRDSVDLRAIVLILGGLAALIVLIGMGGGFIPAIAVLFAATAAAFGRRALATDLALGLLLGFLAYGLFAKLLTLSLPAGPLERLL